MNRSYLECFDMFIILGEYRKKYHQVANTYTECYPNRERKLHMVFKWIAMECYRNVLLPTVKGKKKT